MEMTKWFIHMEFIETQGLIFIDHWAYLCFFETPYSIINCNFDLV